MKKLFLILAMTCSAAHAELWTGNKMLEMMNGNSAEELVAIGYVTGAVDGLEVGPACVKKGITVSQIYELTKKALVEQPQHRHYQAALFVNLVITTNFACETSKPAKAGAKT